MKDAHVEQENPEAVSPGVFKQLLEEGCLNNTGSQREEGKEQGYSIKELGVPVSSGEEKISPKEQ